MGKLSVKNSQIAPAFSVCSSDKTTTKESRGTRHEHLWLYKATAAQKLVAVCLSGLKERRRES